MSQKDIERQLKEWREGRARKTPSQPPAGRRTLRVNGQDVVVIRKSRPKLQAVQD